VHRCAARRGTARQQRALLAPAALDGSTARGVRTLDERESRVDKLHAHALQPGRRHGDVEQMQDHRLLWAQHHAAGNHGRQRVANLAGGAGDQNTHRLGTKRRHGERTARQGNRRN